MSERNLQKQIKLIEKTIKIKESKNEDVSYEKELIKSWKEYLPGGKHFKDWEDYCKGSETHQNAKIRRSKVKHDK